MFNSFIARASIVAFTLAPLTLLVLGPGQSHPRNVVSATIPYAKIASLIKERCVACHNAKKHPEKVDLSSYATLMKSGEHGPIVVAGHPEKSPLIKYIDGEKQPRMPFKRSPLKVEEVALVKRWVAAGAKG